MKTKLLLLLLTALTAHAQSNTLTVTWGAVSQTNLGGYIVAYGPPGWTTNSWPTFTSGPTSNTNLTLSFQSLGEMITNSYSVAAVPALHVIGDTSWIQGDWSKESMLKVRKMDTPTETSLTININLNVKVGQ